MLSRNEYDKQRYLAKKEEIKKRALENYYGNKEKRLSIMKEYRDNQENKEKQSKYMKKYWEENKESLAKANKEYYENHKKKPIKTVRTEMSKTNRQRYLEQIKKRNL